MDDALEDVSLGYIMSIQVSRVGSFGTIKPRNSDAHALLRAERESCQDDEIKVAREGYSPTVEHRAKEESPREKNKAREVHSLFFKGRTRERCIHVLSKAERVVRRAK
jgi:hypothetical protein